MVRKMVKRILRYYGYGIHRMDWRIPTIINIYDDSNQVYPYIENFEMDHIKFAYWVTDDEYKNWYNPSEHSNWCVNSAYKEFISKSDKVLDIGCNIGFTSCLFRCLAGKDGLVVGIDVISANCLIASAQVGLNLFDNCHILNLAAADFNGKIKVRNTHNSAVALHHNNESVEIDSIRCDELINTYGYFDVIKVDVEGFETAVFKGSPELLSKKPKLLIELHGPELKSYGSDYKELFEIITAHEYEGLMCLDPAHNSKLQDFDMGLLINNQIHANVFLRSKA